MERVLFIYNPHSGRGLIKANLPEILDIYSAANCRLMVHATQERMDAAKVAAEYIASDACDRIICAGGDGTLDEVAGAVMRSGKQVPIGIISAGSTNDFGYSLGIPEDIVEAARLAIAGRPFSCDIASFNDKYFTYTAAFGIFTDVSYDTPQYIKNAMGHVAYLLNGMTKLNQVRTFHAKIDTDKGSYEDDFILGMIVSSNSVGGFRGITGEGVELDDGLHELMLIRAPKHIGGLTEAVNEVLSHKYNGKYFVYDRVSRADFCFDDDTAWSLDGEYGGSGKKAHIEVVRQGIRYIRGKDR